MIGNSTVIQVQRTMSSSIVIGEDFSLECLEVEGRFDKEKGSREAVGAGGGSRN